MQLYSNGKTCSCLRFFEQFFWEDVKMFNTRFNLDTISNVKLSWKKRKILLVILPFKRYTCIFVILKSFASITELSAN